MKENQPQPRLSSWPAITFHLGVLALGIALGARTSQTPQAQAQTTLIATSWMVPLASPALIQKLIASLEITETAAPSADPRAQQSTRKSKSTPPQGSPASRPVGPEASHSAKRIGTVAK
jgi:hypothetical protein